MKDTILYNRVKHEFMLTFIFILISSVSLFCICFSDINAGGFKSTLAYILGITFWLGVILGQIFFWKGNSNIKRLKSNKKSCSGKIGLVSFLRNKEAAFFDMLFLISALMFIILVLFKISNEILVLLCVSILFLSFSFHCILNGKNYTYIKNYKRSAKKGEICDD